MRRGSYLLLLLLLSITLSAEGLLSLTLVWRVLATGGSRTGLGLLLCAMALLPFSLQHLFPRARTWLAAHPSVAFRYERRIGALFALLGAAVYEPSRVGLLYAFACIGALTSFVNHLCLESMYSRLVLERKITSRLAARTLQTATQMGSLLGAALAGLLLEHARVQVTLLVYGAATAIGGLGITTLMRHAFVDVERDAVEAAANTPCALVPSHGGLSCAAIAAVTAHIAAFNLLVPILAQDVHHWRPGIFAAVDACFGLGAFGAVLLLFRHSLARSIALAGGLIASTSFLAICSVPAAAALAAVSLGYCANIIRIHHREALYAAQVKDNDTHLWSSRLVLSVTMARCCTPLVLGAIVRFVDASMVCVINACLVGCTIAACGCLNKLMSGKAKTVLVR